MVKSLPPTESEPLLVETISPPIYGQESGKSIVAPFMDDKDQPESKTISEPVCEQPNPDLSEELTKLRGTELFKQQCHFSLAKHRLAATYFGTLQFWTFTIPGATIGATSGIMAFVATSGLFADRTNEILNLAVGCFSFLVVFLQTLSAQLQYDARSQMHTSTAIDLRDLREDLENMENESKVMMRYRKSASGEETDKGRGGGNNGDNSGAISDQQVGQTGDIENDGENTQAKNGLLPHHSPEVLFDGIQKRYNQCLKGCKSVVPLPINDAFDQLDSRLNATMTIMGHTELKKIYGSSYNNIIWFQACNDLSLEFSCFHLWALQLPNAADAVDATMAKLQRNISKRGKDYWNVLLEDTSATQPPPESEIYVTRRQASSVLLVGILVVGILLLPMVIVQAIEWKSRPAPV